MVDLSEHLPFNLFPGEMKPPAFRAILELAIMDITHGQQSNALGRIIRFLGELAKLNKPTFERLDELEKNAFLARGFWLNTLRDRFEGGRNEYNPRFPFRIQPWLSGKIMLLEEVYRSPRGHNAARVIDFLLVWKALIDEHHKGSLIL